MSYQQSGADAVDNEEVKTHGNDDGPHSSAIFDPKMTEYEFPKEPSPADYALHPIRCVVPSLQSLENTSIFLYRNGFMIMHAIAGTRMAFSLNCP
jgi:hypothetical protein